jgi:exodeoxyribonuclease VIII
MQVATQETNAQYHADTTRLSNSMLNVLARKNGPQLFNGYYISKTLELPEQTESMLQGDVIHCLTTEPHEFNNRFADPIPGLNRIRVAGKAAWNCFELKLSLSQLYVAKPEINRRTTEGRKEYELFLQLAGERTVLSPEDYLEAEAFLKALESTRGKTLVSREQIEVGRSCAKALLAHDTASILEQPAAIEQRIDFEIDGVPMRCKPDWFSSGLRLIIDIKSTQDASPEGFKKSADEFGYYRQAWLYREAVRLVYGIDCRFLFACVETSQPHSVACYEPTEAMMSQGENDLRALLSEYRYRYESGDWRQDWSKGINPMDLPTWHKPRTFFE